MKLSWANRITVLRILLIVPFISLMLKINDSGFNESTHTAMRLAAVVIFVIMAVSDGVDGYLARRKNQITQLGMFLDPLADKLLISSASILLASKTGHINGFPLPVTVMILIISKDLLILIGFIIVYFITSRFLISPVFAGKLATAVQLSMVASILLAPEISKVFSWWIYFLRFLWWSAAGTAVLATLIYIRDGWRYIEQHELNNTNRNKYE
jgi:cardiolipin synthase (CMP-forming)